MHPGCRASSSMGRAVAIAALLWSGNHAILTSAQLPVPNARIPWPLGNRADRGLATTSTAENCSTELLDCSEDDICLACITSGHVNTAECSKIYPTTENLESTYCHTIASAYCCAAYNMLEESISCVESALVIEYWTCTLDSNGCTEDDIPCFEDEGLIPTTSNGGNTNSASSQDGSDDSLPASESSRGTQTASIEMTFVVVVTASLLCVTVGGAFTDYLMANFKASTNPFG